MTVINTTDTIRENGNGVKVDFDFPFKIFNTSDLEVYKIDTSVSPEVPTLQVEGVDYTAVKNTSIEGGTVTYTVAPTADEDSFIGRNLPLTQLTDIPREANFPEESIENEFDKSRMIDIQQQTEIEKKFGFGPTSSFTNTTMPDPEADFMLGWDPTGNFLVNIDPNVVGAGSAAAAAASAAAALVSENNAATSESNASTSASNAAASAAAAAAEVVNAQAEVTYAAEWANKAEDSLVSAAAGGDLVDDYSALHWANKAAASAAAVNIPVPAFPADEGRILVARAAGLPGSAYTLEDATTTVDGFTIVDNGSFIATAPFILDNIMLNAMQILENGSLAAGTMVDGFRDTYTDQTGIDLGASTDQVFEGGSYRTPPIQLATDTKLLLSGDTYNGALEVFDSSGQDHVITQNGNAKLSSRFSKWGNGSLFLNGVDQYLTLADSPDWDITANNTDHYTIDGWIKMVDSPTGDYFIGQYEAASLRWAIFADATGLRFNMNNGGANTISTGLNGNGIKDNEWHHFALAKVAGTSVSEYAMYLDGAQIGYDRKADTQTFTGLLYIGSLDGTTGFTNAYLDDFRITKSNAFSATPINAPILITGEGADEATTARNFGTGGALTFANGAKLDNAAPTGPKFNATTSLFFDGTNDQITVANSGGNNDYYNIANNLTDSWTIDCWINPNSLSGARTIASQNFGAPQDYWQLLTFLGNFQFIKVTNTGATNETVTSSGGPTLNVWTHVALVKSAAVVALYINGTRSGSSLTWTATSGDHPTKNAYIGSRFDNIQYWSGYIEQFRMVRTNLFGVNPAVAGSFTVPTAAVTQANSGVTGITVPTTAHVDTANTLLLLPFNSGSQADLTDISSGGAGSPHTVTTVNGAGVTGIYGNAYLTFDGTGDYLSVPDAAGFAFGTGTFSVDTWIRRKVSGAAHQIYHKRTGAASRELSFSINASNLLVLTTNDGTAITATSAATVNDRLWHHVLAVRVGSDLGVYLDGTQVAFATGTLQSVSSTSELRIGADQSGTSAFNGDMDDYHVNSANLFSAAPVVGLSDTITVPATEVLADGNSVLLINANSYDESASYHIPTFNGVVVSSAQSQFGGFSYLFDGTNDDISFPDHSNWDIFKDLTTDFTIQMWVRHTDHAGTETYLAHTQDANNYWRLEHTDGTGMRLIVVQASSTVISLTNAGEITDSNFHHIALVKIGSNAGAIYGMYLDGTQVNYTQDTSVVNFTGSLFIGSTGSANYFDGHIDSLQMIENNIFTALPTPGLTDSFIAPVVAPTVTVLTGTLLLQSVAVDVAPALPAPDTIKILIDLEDIDAGVTLNTDIIARVSRDGGTTFTAATLAQTGQATDSRRLVTDEVDVSAQPDPGAGNSDIVYQIETFNNKQMRFHATSELWG